MLFQGPTIDGGAKSTAGAKIMTSCLRFASCLKHHFCIYYITGSLGPLKADNEDTFTLTFIGRIKAIEHLQ